MGVLLTGGAGYIGAHILLELLAAGEPVVVLDDLSTGFRENVPEQVSLVQRSTGDSAALDELFARGGIDTVIHLAASLIVSESVAEPDKYYRNNVVNAEILFRACARHGVRRIVFSSTAAVYGDCGKARVAETDPLTPVSPYGRSKLAAEWLLEDMARAFDLDYGVLRYFNVAGADPAARAGVRSASATHLIQVACEAALGRRAQLEIYGVDYPTKDGTGVRDFIHVSDLARVHVALLGALRAGSVRRETFNCGYGHGYSVMDVVRAVERESGARVPIVNAPRRPGDIAEIVADCTKIRRAVDWAPQFDDIDVIVRDTLRWERRRTHAGQGAA